MPSAVSNIGRRVIRHRLAGHSQSLRARSSYLSVIFETFYHIVLELSRLFRGSHRTFFIPQPYSIDSLRTLMLPSHKSALSHPKFVSVHAPSDRVLGGLLVLLRRPGIAYIVASVGWRVRKHPRGQELHRLDTPRITSYFLLALPGASSGGMKSAAKLSRAK
jgi:hypothetical protein